VPGIPALWWVHLWIASTASNRWDVGHFSFARMDFLPARSTILTTAWPGNISSVLRFHEKLKDFWEKH
jgi:hypothetical protein